MKTAIVVMLALLLGLTSNALATEDDPITGISSTSVISRVTNYAWNGAAISGTSTSSSTETTTYASGRQTTTTTTTVSALILVGGKLATSSATTDSMTTETILGQQRVTSHSVYTDTFSYNVDGALTGASGSGLSEGWDYILNADGTVKDIRYSSGAITRTYGVQEGMVVLTSISTSGESWLLGSSDPNNRTNVHPGSGDHFTTTTTFNSFSYINGMVVAGGSVTVQDQWEGNPSSGHQTLHLVSYTTISHDAHGNVSGMSGGYDTGASWMESNVNGAWVRYTLGAGSGITYSLGPMGYFQSQTRTYWVSNVAGSPTSGSGGNTGGGGYTPPTDYSAQIRAMYGNLPGFNMNDPALATYVQFWNEEAQTNGGIGFVNRAWDNILGPTTNGQPTGQRNTSWVNNLGESFANTGTTNGDVANGWSTLASIAQVRPTYTP